MPRRILISIACGLQGISASRPLDLRPVGLGRNSGVCLRLDAGPADGAGGSAGLKQAKGNKTRCYAHPINRQNSKRQSENSGLPFCSSPFAYCPLPFCLLKFEEYGIAPEIKRNLVEPGFYARPIFCKFLLQYS